MLLFSVLDSEIYLLIRQRLEFLFLILMYFRVQVGMHMIDPLYLPVHLILMFVIFSTYHFHLFLLCYPQFRRSLLQQFTLVLVK